MARWFRGAVVQKLDSKGRVSIPAAFRRVIEENDPDFVDGLQAQFVLVHGDQRRNFIEGFSMAAINEVDQKISQMPRASQKRRKLERMFSGQAQQFGLDENGRIVLPSFQREKIGLKDEAYFIASGDTFQIWHPKTYEEHQKAADAWLDDYGDDFDPLSLLDDVDGN